MRLKTLGIISMGLLLLSSILENPWEFFIPGIAGLIIIYLIIRWVTQPKANIRPGKWDTKQWD